MELSSTPFETVLLDCIVTAVVSVCIKKNLVKIGELFVQPF